MYSGLKTTISTHLKSGLEELLRPSLEFVKPLLDLWCFNKDPFKHFFVHLDHLWASAVALKLYKLSTF